MQDSEGNLVELTVSELSGAVKRQIEDGFGRVRVRGELGRVARPASGHVYFDLKDDKAVLAAIMWKGTTARMSVQPEQGLEVILTGKLTTYPGQSRYQMIVESLEPAGEGALMALLNARRQQLAFKIQTSVMAEWPMVATSVFVVELVGSSYANDLQHCMR